LTASSSDAKRDLLTAVEISAAGSPMLGGCAYDGVAIADLPIGASAAPGRCAASSRSSSTITQKATAVRRQVP
jgi:hypothetical protein